MRVTFDCVRAAIVACKHTRLDTQTQSHRESLRGLTALAHWMVTVARHRGWENLVSCMKTYANDCRRIVFEPGFTPPSKGLRRFLRGCLSNCVLTHDGALQMSYIGRALPEGGPKKCAEALAKHKSALTSSVPMSPEILERARLWAVSWSRKRLGKAAISIPALSNGATYVTSRGDGGFASEMLSKNRPEPSIRHTAERFRNLLDAAGEPASDCDIEAFARWDVLRRTSLTSINAKVLPLPERGGKVRIVTKSDSCLQMNLQSIRKWLFNGLRKDRRSAQSVAGDRKVAVEQVFEHPAPRDVWRVVSADLTSASDLLPHALLSAILEGIAEGSELTEETHRLLSQACGPMFCEYPSGEEVITSSGTLMGLPHTWPLLSMVHLFWVDEATRLYRRDFLSRRGNRPSTYPPQKLRWRSAICGDDLIAHWPEGLVKCYHHVAELCGASFSEGKHFVVQDRGCFTEKLFKVRWKSVEVPLLPSQHRREHRAVGRDFPVLGARFVSKRELRRINRPKKHFRLVSDGVQWDSVFPLKSFIDTKEGDVPQWFNVGTSAHSICVDFPHLRDRVGKVVQCLNPGLVRQTNWFGLPATLPRDLGGLGLPPSRGRWDTAVRKWPRWLRSVVGFIAYRQPIKANQGLMSPWSLSACSDLGRQMAEETLEHHLAAVQPQLIKVSKGLPPGFLDLGQVDKAMDRLIGAYSSEMAWIVGLSDRRQKVPSLSKILRTVWKRLRSLVPAARR